jgi:hypothetical protein
LIEHDRKSLETLETLVKHETMDKFDTLAADEPHE